eukprot:2281777-Prymnesium_polylepis.1
MRPEVSRNRPGKCGRETCQSQVDDLLEGDVDPKEVEAALTAYGKRVAAAVKAGVAQCRASPP